MTNADKTQWVERFSLHFRIQHIGLILSVLILVITGIPLWCLRFSTSPWAMGIVDFFGDLETVRTAHRVGAILLMVAFGYHLLYVLIHPRGRRDLIEMLPTTKDFRDFFQNIMYFLGWVKESPQFGRFAYFEKFDYWAAFWGCIIMIGTGLAMWFPDKWSNMLPHAIRSGLLEAVLEAHRDEALLAALALFIWHLYNVHWKPGRFPGTLTWLHGKITLKELEERHPLEAATLTTQVPPRQRAIYDGVQ